MIRRPSWPLGLLLAAMGVAGLLWTLAITLWPPIRTFVLP
jgi:hypothetical protein